MAVIEPQKEPRSFAPIIMTAVLLLIVAGLGLLIFYLVHQPASRTIKLTDAQMKEQAASGQLPLPAGPPFPAMGALPQEADPGATLVSLDLKNVVLSQVTAELSKQAGVKIESPAQQEGILATLMQKRFDFAVDKQPFWEAMAQLCQKAQVFPNTYEQDATKFSLVAGERQELKCPQQNIGACRLILASVTSRFDADLLGAHTADRSLTVSLLLCAEPKLNPYRITPLAVVQEARDENGVSLIRPKDMWDDRNGGGRRSKFVSEVQCLLKFAPNAGQRIAKLKGYVSVILAGANETVTIKDPLTKTNFDAKVDNQTVRLVRIQKNGGNGYEANFKADPSSPVFKDWEGFQQVPKLIDAAGKEFNHGGGGWGGGSATVMDFSVYFNGNGKMSEPAAMTITLPTKMREIRVPFEFTDLPLPH